VTDIPVIFVNAAAADFSAEVSAGPLEPNSIVIGFLLALGIPEWTDWPLELDDAFDELAEDAEPHADARSATAETPAKDVAFAPNFHLIMNPSPLPLLRRRAKADVLMRFGRDFHSHEWVPVKPCTPRSCYLR